MPVLADFKLHHLSLMLGKAYENRCHKNISANISWVMRACNLLLTLQLWHRYWHYFLQWWIISWFYKKNFHQDTEPSENQVYTAIFSSLIKKTALKTIGPKNNLTIYSQGANALHILLKLICSPIYIPHLQLRNIWTYRTYCLYVYTLLEANILGVLCISFRLHANWGTDDKIWKVKCIDEFLRHKPHLVTEVVCQLMNSLQTYKGVMLLGSALQVIQCF